MAPDMMVAFYHHVKEGMEEGDSERLEMLAEIRAAFNGNCGLKEWPKYEKEYLKQQRWIKAGYKAEKKRKIKK